MAKQILNDERVDARLIKAGRDGASDIVQRPDVAFRHSSRSRSVASPTRERRPEARSLAEDVARRCAGLRRAPRASGDGVDHRNDALALVLATSALTLIVRASKSRSRGCRLAASPLRMPVCRSTRTMSENADPSVVSEQHRAKLRVGQHPRPRLFNTPLFHASEHDRRDMIALMQPSEPSANFELGRDCGRPARFPFGWHQDG